MTINEESVKSHGTFCAHVGRWPECPEPEQAREQRKQPLLAESVVIGGGAGGTGGGVGAGAGAGATFWSLSAISRTPLQEGVASERKILIRVRLSSNLDFEGPRSAVLLPTRSTASMACAKKAKGPRKQ